ncbi:MAG: tetratricopeptide repeat protein [Verrucomicrobiota bacterium]
MTAAPHPTPGPAIRLWLFRLGLVLVAPVAFFLGLEGTLRLAGYGRDTRFFIPDEQPGFVRSNPAYTALFLPASFDLRPINFRVAGKKPPGTVRIVVLGESAAQGIPAPAFGFVPQLRALLRARYPDKTIEVVNTGVVAINSHVVHQIARDAARLSPDLFVVYLGNNEVVGPYGPGCAYLPAMPPLRVIRASVWVKSTRTGQLLGAVAARLAGARKPPAEWGGMGMFMEHAVRGDDPRLETTCRNFEANLRDIVRVARNAGAKTLLCTVVSNLKDCPPFLSLNRPDLTEPERAEWQTAFAAGKLAWKLGENAAARAHLLKAWELDPHHADTAFLLASLELQAGNPAAARKLFLEAQQWDALRFRPSPRLNEVARAVAREAQDITFVDAARELGSDPASAGDIAGRELLLEHVHPDWEGNYRIARLMAEGAERALFAAQPGRGPWLDSAGVAAAVGYTPVERFGLLQRAALITREPPFPNQLTYAEDQARIAREMAAAQAVRRDPAARHRARETVRAALEGDPANPELAKLAVELADDAGDLAGALEQVRRARALQPDNFALAADEAIKLARLARHEEAEKLLLATAAACTPRDFAKLTPAIADFYLRTKRLADGRRWFDAALAREPRSTPVQFYRGRLAQAAGDAAAAESAYRTVLETDPANEAALETLFSLLAAQGRTKEAEELCLVHAGFQPNNQANHFRVAQILETDGRIAEAAQALLAATRSGPAPVAVHLRLANLFYTRQQRREALDHLATAWRLSPDEGDREATASIRELLRRIQAEK